MFLVCRQKNNVVKNMIELFILSIYVFIFKNVFKSKRFYLFEFKTN